MFSKQVNGQWKDEQTTRDGKKIEEFAGRDKTSKTTVSDPIYILILDKNLLKYQRYTVRNY